jgi:hypothetical protein
LAPRPAWAADEELVLTSRHIWGHAREGNRYSVLPGEETITDVAMLSLRRRRFGYTRFRGRLPEARRVFVHKFSNPQESVTGADWNLLLVSPGRRRNLRVQAKRLYPDGRYTSQKATQTRRLIAVSAAQRAGAAFGFYNGPQASGVVSACALTDETRLGCTVIPATLATGAWSNAGVGAAAIPLPCVVRCYCYGGGGTPPTDGDKYPRGSTPAGRTPVLPVVDAAVKAFQGSLTKATWLTKSQQAKALAEFDESTLAEGPLQPAIQDWLATGDTTALDEVGANLFPDAAFLVVVLDENVEIEHL